MSNKTAIATTAEITTTPATTTTPKPTTTVTTTEALTTTSTQEISTSTILHTNSTTIPPTGLSAGEITAAVLVPLICVVVILALLFYFLYWRRRQQPKKSKLLRTSNTDDEEKSTLQKTDLPISPQASIIYQNVNEDNAPSSPVYGNTPGFKPPLPIPLRESTGNDPDIYSGPYGIEYYTANGIIAGSVSDNQMYVEPNNIQGNAERVPEDSSEQPEYIEVFPDKEEHNPQDYINVPQLIEPEHLQKAHENKAVATRSEPTNEKQADNLATSVGHYQNISFNSKLRNS